MKKSIFIFLLCLIAKFVSAQNAQEEIKRACLNYIEGFYEGDTTKLIQSLKPSLYKFGYWKDKKSDKYGPDGNMTYRQALDYAKNVLDKKNFAKSDAPKKLKY